MEPGQRRRKPAGKLMLWLRVLLLFCLILASCSPRSVKLPDTSLPRAAPSYLHWLQKQSLLYQAPEIIAQVSQSSRVWLQSAEPRRADVLLNAAPNWLQIDEDTPSVFAHAAALASHAHSMGFGGIYLGDTAEKPDIWLARSNTSTGHNPASFQFASGFGTNADYERLVAAAENSGMELGASLLAGATGQGPDFVLQARNAASHTGLYAMLAAPSEALSLLPDVKDEWDCQALDERTVVALAEKGAIPTSLARDAAPWASKGGWAVSGSATGADGASRRWLYRYAGSPGQPVFAWQDPSGLAAKIFAAAVIRHTGLLGQTLAGLRFEPLMGLEPQTSTNNAVSLSPGLDALDAISRQIHRYGGWAFQADALPASAIPSILESACDFCRDDITDALVTFGVLQADGRPVAALYRNWLNKGIDISRLARGFNANLGFNPALLLDNPAWAEIVQKLHSYGEAEPILEQLLVRHGLEAQTAHRFLLAWRLGMPGLVFLAMPSANDPWLANFMQTRHKAGLAVGKALQVMRGNGGGFGLLSSLPNGGFWLLACNFGVNPDELSLILPATATTAVDAATGENLVTRLNGQSFRLALDGRAARNVLFH